MKKKFSFRAFVSLYVVLSFLIITASGIVLFLAPPGRVANWSNWRLLGLLKSQWQAIHTIFTFIFVLAIGIHLFFNWKPLMAYLKTKISSIVIPRNETYVSIFLALIIFLFTVNGAVPFSSVMNFGEDIKNSWSTNNNEPPIPHAEEQSLSKFAQTVKIDPNSLSEKLKSKGIKIESESATISDIAKQNNVSPSEIYKIVAKDTQLPLSAPKEGRGYGRKTIEQICSEMNLSAVEGINRLRENGIDANKDEKLRDVATRNHISPIDVANMISGSSQN